MVMAELEAAAIRNDRSLQPLVWEEIREPGAYVELATGTLLRVSHEALLKGALPLSGKDGAAGSQFVRVSRDPSIFPLGARIICARYNIQPNF
jgi:hypothetical protein